MSTTAALQTHRSKWPRFAPSATRAPKSVRPTQPEQILMAGLLGAKSYLQLVDIPRVILHRQSTPDQTYYILGLPASSKYPIYPEWLWTQFGAAAAVLPSPTRAPAAPPGRVGQSATEPVPYAPGPTPMPYGNTVWHAPSTQPRSTRVP